MSSFTTIVLYTIKFEASSYEVVSYDSQVVVSTDIDVYFIVWYYNINKIHLYTN